MFYLLSIFYAILFFWLITRIQFFKNSGLTNRILVFLFSTRIIAALITCYFNLYYFPVSDSLAFHNGGLVEYNLLFQNTHEYFVNIFQNPHQNGYGRFLDSSDSYWNDTKSNFMYKLLSIFDIFSGKNFFINTLFFNFLVFFGLVALYKVFIKIFPDSNYKIILCIFFLPSALFFTSMIHRDGLILLSLSMVIYHLYFMMNDRLFSWKKILIIFFFLIMILVLRNYILFALIPALIGWIIARNNPKHSFFIFSGTYAISLILFFFSGYISPKTDLPQFVSKKHLAFVAISKSGSSTIYVNPLYPNFKSFFINAPQALNHSLMRPYFTEIKSLVYIPFALENFLVEILILLFIFWKKKNLSVNPLVYFCLFFSVTIFLIIGYTVPIIGAIVRYKSIYSIFFILPMVCFIDWNKLKKDNIKNKNI